MIYISLPFNKIGRYNSKKKKITKIFDLNYENDMIIDYQLEKNREIFIALTQSGKIKVLLNENDLREYIITDSIGISIFNKRKNI